MGSIDLTITMFPKGDEKKKSGRQLEVIQEQLRSILNMIIKKSGLLDSIKPGVTDHTRSRKHASR